MARGVLVLLMTLLAAACATPRERPATQDLVRDAFHLGFPVYEMARVRDEYIERVTARGRPPINQFGHRATLSDHTDRVVTTPNNDTLYSAAWLDLSGGPVILSVPGSRQRYLSLALMDMFTDNFAYSGTRAAGGRPERLFVAGPGWSGTAPQGMRLVRAPTDDVWALARTLVDGPSDLAAAAAVQQQVRVESAPSTQAARLATRPPLRPTAEQFLAVVNEALARAPAHPAHSGRIARLQAVGIRPGEADAWARLPEDVRAEWTRRWQGLNAGLRGGLERYVTRHEGWSYPQPGLGNFGQNDAYRAAVALEGLAALEPVEAMYMFSRETAQGALFDGARSAYRIRLPAEIPVDGFWSLTMYEESEGRLFIVANALRRYSIGNRTPSLRRNRDGSIDILIQHEAPGEDLAANWLPAPAGPFRLSFRAYLPRPALRDGRFRLPGVRELSR